MKAESQSYDLNSVNKLAVKLLFKILFNYYLAGSKFRGMKQFVCELQSGH